MTCDQAHFEDNVVTICDSIRSNLKLQEFRLDSAFNYSCLPLCVIDSVYSIGVRYGAVRKVIDRWCSQQTPPWPKYQTETPVYYSTSDAIRVFDGMPIENLSRDVFGNMQRTSARGGILKGDAVVRFTRILQAHGIERFSDLVEKSRLDDVEGEIRQIPGQSSGISWKYFLMLAGDDDLVKPDRMILRFIRNALKLQEDVALDCAISLIRAAAYRLRPEFPHVTPRLLDNAIWEFQRNPRRSSQFKQ